MESLSPLLVAIGRVAFAVAERVRSLLYRRLPSISFFHISVPDVAISYADCIAVLLRSDPVLVIADTAAPEVTEITKMLTDRASALGKCCAVLITSPIPTPLGDMTFPPDTPENLEITALTLLAQLDPTNGFELTPTALRRVLRASRTSRLVTLSAKGRYITRAVYDILSTEEIYRSLRSADTVLLLIRYRNGHLLRSRLLEAAIDTVELAAPRAALYYNFYTDLSEHSDFTLTALALSRSESKI